METTDTAEMLELIYGQLQSLSESIASGQTALDTSLSDLSTTLAEVSSYVSSSEVVAQIQRLNDSLDRLAGSDFADVRDSLDSVATALTTSQQYYDISATISVYTLIGVGVIAGVLLMQIFSRYIRHD